MTSLLIDVDVSGTALATVIAGSRLAADCSVDRKAAAARCKLSPDVIAAAVSCETVALLVELRMTPLSEAMPVAIAGTPVALTGVVSVLIDIVFCVVFVGAGNTLVKVAPSLPIAEVSTIRGEEVAADAVASGVAITVEIAERAPAAEVERDAAPTTFARVVGLATVARAADRLLESVTPTASAEVLPDEYAGMGGEPGLAIVLLVAPDGVVSADIR